MQAASRGNDSSFSCKENPTYEDYIANNKVPVGCGSLLYAKFFFYSYVLIVGVVLMRIFIAIVL